MQGSVFTIHPTAPPRPQTILAGRKPRDIVDPNHAPTPTGTRSEVPSRAGLEGIRAILLLQDILVLCGDARGEPDIDIPLRIATRVVPGVERQNHLARIIARVVAQLGGVAGQEHVLPEHGRRVHAEDHFAEARCGDVRCARGEGGRVRSGAVVGCAVALCAVQPCVCGGDGRAPWVWVLA